MTPDYDAVVIGGGPAGYAAALWLARYRRRTLLVEDGTHRNRAVQRTYGYLGLDGASPTELRDRAYRDLLAYPQTEVRTAAVTDVRRTDGGFEVDMDGAAHGACRLVLATGAVDASPDIRGFDEHYGASVFTCPSCDGYEAQGRDVVALGWNEGLADFSLHLFEWAASVTIVTDGRHFEGDGRHRAALTRVGIDIVEETAEAFEGSRGTLAGVRLGDGRLVAADLAFFSIAVTARSELASRLGCALDDEGYVVVDEDGRTSVEGVYAAGDLTPGRHLVQVAAAEGAVAGVACAWSLRGEPGAPMSPRPSPTLETGLAQ